MSSRRPTIAIIDALMGFSTFDLAGPDLKHAIIEAMFRLAEQDGEIAGLRAGLEAPRRVMGPAPVGEGVVVADQPTWPTTTAPADPMPHYPGRVTEGGTMLFCKPGGFMEVAARRASGMAGTADHGGRFAVERAQATGDLKPAD